MSVQRHHGFVDFFLAFVVVTYSYLCRRVVCGNFQLFLLSILMFVVVDNVRRCNDSRKLLATSVLLLQKD
jgi:hypothetical protein